MTAVAAGVHVWLAIGLLRHTQGMPISSVLVRETPKISRR
jgi:hypothetical protein